MTHHLAASGNMKREGQARRKHGGCEQKGRTSGMDFIPHPDREEKGAFYLASKHKNVDKNKRW
jgi:hypothetical protein